jgi:chemotaxis protein methyltransferase CheR
MTRDVDTLGLTIAGLPLLRDLVHQRTGLFYDESRLDTLSDRLAPLVVERGFGSFLDYYYLLKYDGSAACEWSKVFDALSVQETYFWREVDQIKAVACHVVPALLDRRPAGRPLKIWSIPCATGEEPLTIAMVLEQTGAFGRGPIEIHASDGSPAAIARAQQGRYRARAFRALPEHLRDRYFVADGDAFVPRAHLKARITSYSVVNLMEIEQAKGLARECPIVFCRNAFIYFSTDAVRRIVSTLAELMPSPGYLCLGASESLIRVTDRFTLEDVGGSFMYVKR